MISLRLRAQQSARTSREKVCACRAKFRLLQACCPCNLRRRCCGYAGIRDDEVQAVTTRVASDGFHWKATLLGQSSGTHCTCTADMPDIYPRLKEANELWQRVSARLVPALQALHSCWHRQTSSSIAGCRQTVAKAFSAVPTHCYPPWLANLMLHLPATCVL